MSFGSSTERDWAGDISVDALQFDIFFGRAGFPSGPVSDRETVIWACLGNIKGGWHSSTEALYSPPADP